MTFRSSASASVHAVGPPRSATRLTPQLFRRSLHQLCPSVSSVPSLITGTPPRCAISRDQPCRLLYQKSPGRTQRRSPPSQWQMECQPCQSAVSSTSRNQTVRSACSFPAVHFASVLQSSIISVFRTRVSVTGKKKSHSMLTPWNFFLPAG